VLSDNGFPKYSRAHVAIFNTAAQWFLMQVSCLALYRLRSLWIPWIFSQYYVWKMLKDINSSQSCI